MDDDSISGEESDGNVETLHWLQCVRLSREVYSLPPRLVRAELPVSVDVMTITY